MVMAWPHSVLLACDRTLYLFKVCASRISWRIIFIVFVLFSVETLCSQRWEELLAWFLFCSSSDVIPSGWLPTRSPTQLHSQLLHCHGLSILAFITSFSLFLLTSCQCARTLSLLVYACVFERCLGCRPALSLISVSYPQRLFYNLCPFTRCQLPPRLAGYEVRGHN